MDSELIIVALGLIGSMSISVTILAYTIDVSIDLARLIQKTNDCKYCNMEDKQEDDDDDV